jgi:hypothetical protein
MRDVGSAARCPLRPGAKVDRGAGWGTVGQALIVPVGQVVRRDGVDTGPATGQ